jgi:hypothetical protein
MFSFLVRKAPRKIAEKPGDHVLVDLKLDGRLKPMSATEFAKHAPKSMTSKHLVDSCLLVDESLSKGESRTHAIGSGRADDQIYYPGDLGLFGCVFEAWKNHWILRTRPEDWWNPIARRVAKAVDDAAKGESGEFGFPRRGSEKVRELFVSHEGKQNIAIDLPAYTIYDADYNDLFSAFGSQIENRIKCPEYASCMQNDFASSGPEHKISSQINLMASMQEFFTFEMCLMGCGLRGLEMAGSVEDWDSLSIKLKKLRDILKPIQDATRLRDEWWDSVLDVYQNLAHTRKNPNGDPAVAKFWINILMDTTGTKYVGGGGSMPGEPVEVAAYDGWLIRFLTGNDKIIAEDLKNGGAKYLRAKLSGWNEVPMKVSLTWCKPPVVDESTLVAGIVGYKLHNGGTSTKGSSNRMISAKHGSSQQSEEGDDDTDNGDVVPSVEPHHMWAMLLAPSSPLRR